MSSKIIQIYFFCESDQNYKIILNYEKTKKQTIKYKTVKVNLRLRLQILSITVKDFKHSLNDIY